MQTLTLTPRQRMLAAYLGDPVDQIPVAPEFWYYIPARLLKLSMMDFELQVPHWQALLETFKYYQCEGWGIVSPEIPADWGWPETHIQRKLGDGRLEDLSIIESDDFTLSARTLYDLKEPSWQTERYIKNFALDWPIYEYQTLAPPHEMNWKPVQQALEATKEDYLLEVFVGFPFIDFAGNQRQGGLTQVIQDLVDYPNEMKALQEKYIAWISEKTRHAFLQTTARSVFIGSIWSTISLLSPALWRAWDKPVLEAVTKTAHACGGLVHHHFHGKCRQVLNELADLSLDCICPFERPPGGDIKNLHEVRQILDNKTTFNGNVSTVETLIRGTRAEVIREVEEVKEAFRGANRLIVGTGDQVGVETTDENIFTMIEAVRKS